MSSPWPRAPGCSPAPDDRVVLAGHGFGAIVAAWAAPSLGARCAGLVLVDGGWESIEATSGMDIDEFLRNLDEPPEVMRSMTAFLADRAGFDPPTWDADQERAARATVVETHAGKVVPATRPHALEGSVRAMFDYDPADDAGRGVRADRRASGRGRRGWRPRARRSLPTSGRADRGGPRRDPVESFGHDGHNLMRYRPDAVSAAILSIADTVRDRGARMQVVYTPAHLAHDITRRDVHGRADPGQRGRGTGREDPGGARGGRRLPVRWSRPTTAKSRSPRSTIRGWSGSWRSPGPRSAGRAWPARS